ncbi:adhesin (plasmid) [Spiroplasma citri]|uniref:two-component regulator propeller domain-containing protein n=1 Tax=Spiroplasma citri TaxID=2133 RepID=UPI0013A098AC|nr:two-component regulator propeller domain-containing protein [Spiroplasma citri]QIA71757.1 adhesin [Spiroplasma citri]QIA74070.1 adhesin [Spiroplasma citri]
MKKLLSILTISTLTASIPAPLLAAVPLTNTLTSNSNNDYLPLKEFKNIRGDIYRMTIDSKDNIYFSVFANGAFVLKQGETTPTKINGINNVVNSLAVDSNDNIYFGTANGAFVLKQGETTPTKINGITGSKNIAVDNKDNIYFGTNKGIYKLIVGSTTPTKINGINNVVNSLAVDTKDNIYFSLFDNGAYVLKHGETTATKIDGISNNIQAITIDTKDNIYFGMYQDSAYVLKHGETTPNKINGIETIRSIADIKFDKNKKIYIGTDNGVFVLKHGETTATKIDGISNNIQAITIDTKDNIYFGTSKDTYILQTALSWTKQQSKFTLVDNTKKQTWTQNDLLSVDGELNIDIANPNIDKVVFDNVQQGQTNKHWTINVKPETAPRDHNLQVMFTLEGKQYTSEIIVSMQAKINPPTPSKQENLSELIKTTDLGNIFDKNDDTIFSAVNQKNGNVIDDFSQIEITNKDNHSATLSAKPDSKSYKGSVDVKYNVVPTTVVDLQIDLTPTSSQATVIKDYLGQIDTSNLTNPVNTFYYANSESVITMVKPTPSSVITGVVYGCDDKWNKTSQSSNIDSTNGIKLDGSQLATINGKYVVELSDNLGHTNNVYLQIAQDKKITNYFDTDNGKQFEIWAKANGYDNIRGYSASQLNNLFADSKNWQQLASDSQLASAVADRVKTSGKLSSTAPLTKEQVVEQLKTQIPSDIKIDKVNTSNYEKDKVSFVLNQSEFKPNDKVNITVKYNNATADSFTLQIKDSNTPDNKKDGDSKLWIIGVVVGVLVVLGLAYLLFKKFVFDKYILKRRSRKRSRK